MNNKGVISKKLVIGIAIIILIVVLFFSVNRFLLSPIEGVCEVISENSGDKKVDIVFFVDNVDKSEVEKYSDFLMSSEPFSAHKEKFNFYYAGKTNDCEIVQSSVLLCYSRDLVRQSSVCNNDYIITLSNKPSNIRSSSYMNVMSINLNHPDNVLLHEFGHAFANLADEYVPSTIPRGSENCQKECEDFEVDECYEGCSKDSYYRSSSASIMKTLSSSDYEELNTQIINKALEKYG